MPSTGGAIGQAFHTGRNFSASYGTTSCCMACPSPPVVLLLPASCRGEGHRCRGQRLCIWPWAAEETDRRRQKVPVRHTSTNMRMSSLHVNPASVFAGTRKTLSMLNPKKPLSTNSSSVFFTSSWQMCNRRVVLWRAGWPPRSCTVMLRRIIARLKYVKPIRRSPARTCTRKEGTLSRRPLQRCAARGSAWKGVPGGTGATRERSDLLRRRHLACQPRVHVQEALRAPAWIQRHRLGAVYLRAVLDVTRPCRQPKHQAPRWVLEPGQRPQGAAPVMQTALLTPYPSGRPGRPSSQAPRSSGTQGCRGSAGKYEETRVSRRQRHGAVRMSRGTSLPLASRNWTAHPACWSWRG